MENEHILLLIFISFFSFTSFSNAHRHCHPASCGPIVICSPFGCFPGFDLYCNKKNQTIIQLPPSRSYTVTKIDYDSHVIYINHDFCRPNEINELDITDTPFEFPNLETYTFYNCSIQNSSFVHPLVSFPCLNNHSVIAIRQEMNARRRMRTPSHCTVIKEIYVSIPLDGDIRSDVELMWYDPYFESSENQGISTSAKCGLSLGIGVPATIVIIGMICYTASRVTTYSETSHNHQGNDISSIPIIPQQPSGLGLDMPTIESYPIMILGESRRLPNDDSACAICLSDYKPKELLKTIPECNHYFHLDCIDEWLKLNATCPVCRNAPQSSSLTTPCSSTSTNYVESS